MRLNTHNPAVRGGLAIRRRGPCRRSGSSVAVRAQGETSVEGALGEYGGLLIPGCYDAFSARIMSAQGYRAAFVSGAAVSATLLGEPDVGLLTPPEMARKCNQICASHPSLIVIADADTGGGNALNVQRTIRQLIANGCKGCIMEDQVWPKKSGSIGSKMVESMEEFCSRVSAARAAIGDSDFFLIARTDARSTSAKHGLQTAITRANLYVDAGANASLIEGPRSHYELATIAEHAAGWRAVSLSEGSLTPMHSYQQLKEMGFHLVFYPMSGLFASAKALDDVYHKLGEVGTTSESTEDLMPFDQYRRLIGLEEKLILEEKYSRGKEGDKLTVRVPGKSRRAVAAAPDNGSS